jgi:F-type H+-transporting ATPase subunit a
VGVLEVVTILFRPVTLSFRLYGNIFAGENMLESMAMLVQDPPWLSFLASCLIPIPFYFLEVLVGLVQALVFMLLTSVFTLLICMHDEGHATAHH